MPAAAVIPAPVAYIKVAAVKKLVVGFLVWWARSADASRVSTGARLPSFRRARLPFTGPGDQAIWNVYFEKIRVFKAGLRF